MKIFFGLLVCLFAVYGCAAPLRTVQRGTVSAEREKALQDAKDALNTYGFDIKNIDESDGTARVSGERDTHQEAWIEIEPGSGPSSAVEVKVNREGDNEVGADTIFDDMKARSQK